MSETFKVETVKAEGFTVAALVWRLLRRQPVGFVAKVLDVNPGLAALGPLLPVGTVIRFPIEQATEQPRREVVKLWD